MKNGLTLEEHKALGAELSQLSKRLLGITEKLRGAYDRESGSPRIISEKLIRNLDDLRDHLNLKLFFEHEAAANNLCYYPGAKPVKAADFLSSYKPKRGSTA